MAAGLQTRPSRIMLSRTGVCHRRYAIAAAAFIGIGALIAWLNHRLHRAEAAQRSAVAESEVMGATC